MDVAHVPAERPLAAVLVRRVRERPWTLCAVVLIVASLGATAFDWLVRGEFLSLPAAGMWTWAAIVAVITAGTIGRRFHRAPPAPGDTSDPVRARWLHGAPGDFAGPDDAEVHDLGDTVRFARFTREGSDVALLACGTIVGLVLGGSAAALAFPCLGWALGLPRRGRAWIDVPWAAVRSWEVAGGTLFTLRCGAPGRPFEVALEARFSQRERLTGLLAHRIGAPRPLTPNVEERAADAARDDDMTWRVLWRRVRSGGATLTGAVLLAAGVVVHTVGWLAGSPGARLTGTVVAGVGGLVCVAGASLLGNRWRGARPALDDSANPVSVVWRNRPGWPGPRQATAHLLGDRLRVVGHEVNPWDVLVIAAAALVGWSVGGIMGLMGVTASAGALGFPRRVRVTAELPWDEITADVRVTEFEIRSTLAPPADLVRLEAKYSHRERLTEALAARLGGRARVAGPPSRRVAGERPRSAGEPTAADLAAKAEALRRLGDGR